MSGFTVNCNYCESASTAALHYITNEWLGTESGVDPAVTRQLQLENTDVKQHHAQGIKVPLRVEMRSVTAV